MPKKAISIAARKSKGRNLQKTVRDMLLKAYPELTCDDVRSCPMGSTGADLQFSARAKQRIPFDWECKARAKIALIYEALAQAQREAHRPGIAVIKADRAEPLAVLKLADLISILMMIDSDSQNEE